MNNNFNDVCRYDDIIDLPHPKSKSHPQMAIHDRAAQFSPFAALTGYDGAIKETARLTNNRIDLDEAAKTLLDEKLQILQERLSNQSEIEITYFLPDEKKTGGAYVSTIGIVKKIDENERAVVMQDEIRIPMEEIISITGDMLEL